MLIDKIIIPDNRFLPVHEYSLQEKYQGLVGSILIPHMDVFKQTQLMASRIDRDYTGKDLHILCVMTGADMFCTDIVNSLRDYVSSGPKSISRHNHSAKSYIGTNSSGNVTLSGEFSWVKNSDILVVEDIVDTGLTMNSLTQRLREEGANTIKVATLLEKRLAQGSAFHADYVGFSIPDEFVIGYGLDYNDNFRDMLHIGIINEEGKRKFA